MPPIEVRPMLNEAVVNGKRLRLTVMLGELLQALAKRPGASVRTTQLLCVAEGVRAACRLDDPTDAKRVLRAHIHLLRKRLKGTGITVAGERGPGAEGYALAEEAA